MMELQQPYFYCGCLHCVVFKNCCNVGTCMQRRFIYKYQKISLISAEKIMDWCDRDKTALAIALTILLSGQIKLTKCEL